VPIPVRIALLAGVWRAHDSPELCQRIEDESSARSGSRFDAVKRNLLRDLGPEVSYLQQM
jgi:hypothetical protein